MQNLTLEIFWPWQKMAHNALYHYLALIFTTIVGIIFYFIGFTSLETQNKFIVRQPKSMKKLSKSLPIAIVVLMNVTIATNSNCVE